MLRMAAQTESTKYSSMNFLDDVLAGAGKAQLFTQTRQLEAPAESRRQGTAPPHKTAFRSGLC